MGGKNPAIVTRSADLDEAAEGVMRSAFGFDGQKCSANSRVYVDRSVAREFVDKLVERAQAIRVGDPTERENWMGPVINQKALDTFTTAVDEAKADGGTHRGRRRASTTAAATSPPRPSSPACRSTIASSATSCSSRSSSSARSTRSTRRCDEANDTAYGLTAGIFSRDPGEVQRFLDTIQAGVVYVNRRAGATTGAWPGIQSFGGWKGSGSSGKGGLGPYYVQQFLREQSQTVVGQ